MDQQHDRENETQKPLADLPLSDEQSETTKAGAGAHSGGFGAGKVIVQDDRCI